MNPSFQTVGNCPAQLCMNTQSSTTLNLKAHTICYPVVVVNRFKVESDAALLPSNLITIEKLVLGGTWTGDLPIFSPDVLTSAPSRQARSWNADTNLAACLQVTHAYIYILSKVCNLYNAFS